MTAVSSLKDKTGSGTIFTVEWVLGTDRLLGTCYCGARREAEDPVELWEWLTAHPVGHDGG